MEFRFSICQAVYKTLVSQDRLVILAAASDQHYHHKLTCSFPRSSKGARHNSQGLEETR